MKFYLKALPVVTASLLLALAATSASQAQSVLPQPQYNQYQQADGGYASLADYTRSIEGTPCGMECTRAQMPVRDFYGRTNHW